MKGGVANHEVEAGSERPACKVLIAPSAVGKSGNACCPATLSAKERVPLHLEDKGGVGTSPSRIDQLMASFYKDGRLCPGDCVITTKAVIDKCEQHNESIVLENALDFEPSKWSKWKFSNDFCASRRLSGLRSKSTALSEMATLSKASTTSFRHFRMAMREATYRQSASQEDESDEIEILEAPQAMPPYFMHQAPMKSAVGGELSKVAAADVSFEGYAIVGAPARALLRRRFHSGQATDSNGRKENDGPLKLMIPYKPEGKPSPKAGKRPCFFQSRVCS